MPTLEEKQFQMRKRIVRAKIEERGRYIPLPEHYLIKRVRPDRRTVGIMTHAEYRMLVSDARIQYRNALSAGKIVPEPCAVCGELISEGHHEDYRKPLAIIWLCRRHHRERHACPHKWQFLGENSGMPIKTVLRSSNQQVNTFQADSPRVRPNNSE